MQPQKKVLSVESIRGWACFMVLMSHLSLTFYPYLHAFNGEADPKAYPIQLFIHDSPFGFFFSGTSAVFIFFVLSGFILTKVALKDGNKSKRILSMSLKRYPRLMIPALASCLIAYAAIYSFDITSPKLSDWINRYGNSQDYSLIGAIYSGMVDVFFLSGRSAYNPVLWTMKIELLGSFAVYMLCLNRITFNIRFLLGAVFSITFISTFLKIIDANLGFGLVSFYGGYLFSIYGQKISSRIALIFVIVGLYLAGAHNTSSSYSFIHFFAGDYTYKLCNFMSGFFIVYAIIFSDKLNYYFSGRISVFLGKVSFSVYLIHLPILSTFGVLTFNHLFQLTGMYDFSAILTSILSILIIYASSLLFFNGIDLKGMAFSNNFAKYVISWLQTFNKRL